jgi:AcrR family transcriptional regulator
LTDGTGVLAQLVEVPSARSVDIRASEPSRCVAVGHTRSGLQYELSISSQSDGWAPCCTLDVVPKLWNDTIEEHRRTVHAAILDTTAALVEQHGLTAVTMSQIAQAAGIGRATLYKYFPDVEAILVAWHERQVHGHLEQLAAIVERAGDPGQRLQAVLEMYARIQHEHHGHDLSAALHRGEHMVAARRHLHAFVAGLVTEAAAAGEIRDDVPAAELADFCLHALAGATTLRSKAAVGRLVGVTLSGLRPQPRDA